MQHVDERILEHFSEVFWSSPKHLAFHVEATPSRIAERLQVMARLGYVVPAIDDDDPESAEMWELGRWWGALSGWGSRCGTCVAIASTEAA